MLKKSIVVICAFLLFSPAIISCDDSQKDDSASFDGYWSYYESYTNGVKDDFANDGSENNMNFMRFEDGKMRSYLYYFASSELKYCPASDYVYIIENSKIKLVDDLDPFDYTIDSTTLILKLNYIDVDDGYTEIIHIYKKCDASAVASAIESCD